jgi:hypothetical protein
MASTSAASAILLKDDGGAIMVNKCNLPSAKTQLDDSVACILSHADFNLVIQVSRIIHDKHCAECSHLRSPLVERL